MSRLSKDDDIITLPESTLESTISTKSNVKSCIKPFREQQETEQTSLEDIMCQPKTKSQNVQENSYTTLSPSKMGLVHSVTRTPSQDLYYSKANLTFSTTQHTRTISSISSKVITVTSSMDSSCVSSKYSTKPSLNRDIEYYESDRITTINTPVTNNGGFNYESVHYLSDIQEENASALSSDNLAQIVVTTTSTPTIDTKESSNSVDTNSSSPQTLLLAVPQNVNFNQFSNQTLNLDYNSQQLLHSLLHLSTPPDSSSSVSVQANPNSQINENTIDDSNQLVIDIPSALESVNHQKNDNHTHNSTPNHLVEYRKDFLDTFNESTSIEQGQSTEPVQEKVENDQCTQHDMHGGQQDQLPTAAINVDMINGQPLYTIQLNGISIPIAAITIPTSDGPRHLQSAITSLPPSATLKVPDQFKKSNIPIQFSQDEDFQQQKKQSKSSNTITPTKAKHTCEFCGKCYVRSWSYFSHVREHMQSNDNKCAICSKQFDSIHSLKSHMITHQTSGVLEAKIHSCTTCSKDYNNANSLKAHQQTHNKEKTFKCKVEGCEKSFPNSGSLKTHQRVHQEDKPFKCTTIDCGKAFKTPSELSRHEFRHTGEKPYKCDKCDKSFVRNDDLRRHSFIHTGQKRFKCDQCDFSCIQSFDLVKHKYIHGGEKPYKCQLCPKQFTRPARLREHERFHTGERPFECEECGKCFTQMTTLKSHKLIHEAPKTSETLTELTEQSNKFICPLCNKEFVSDKTLKRHAIVHSGEKPFECKSCGRKFARASDLKVHSPVHYEEKPYKCEQCDRSFTRFSSLKEHIRLHTGEFPFKCNYCEKVFNHRSHLNIHLRSHTGERPYKCHLCVKEFSRKISLRQHLRTHGINEASSTRTATSTLSMVTNLNVANEDDVDSNFSDTSFIEAQQTIQLDPSNLQLWKTLQNVMKPLKRKRDDEMEEENGLLQKRLLRDTQFTDYPSSEQNLSTISTSDPEQLQGTIVSTSNVETSVNADNTAVIFHQLPSGELAQSHYLNTDGSTVVAFSLAEGAEDGVESLVGIHSLEGIQGLDTQSLLEQQQHPLNQQLQRNDEMNNM